jgi:hypothetical protein
VPAAAKDEATAALRAAGETVFALGEIAGAAPGAAKVMLGGLL